MLIPIIILVVTIIIGIFVPPILIVSLIDLIVMILMWTGVL
jgi:hypothetical protein